MFLIYAINLRLQKRERLYGPYKLAVKMNLHYNRANDLTQGSIMGTMLRFAVPMILAICCSSATT